MDIIVKRIILYSIGLILLATGVSLSIHADLGVSPVSSLSYGIALISGLSVGISTFLTNFLYLAVQFFITKKLDWKSYSIQLFSVSILSICIDLMIKVTSLLPAPTTRLESFFILLISLVIIAFALSFLLSTKLPLMPYDFLVPLLVDKYNWKISTTRMSCDLINVSVALLLCLIFLQSLGSIGIGTVIAAILVGKILGGLLHLYGRKLRKMLGTS